ncbi:MAG: sigma 54-interacting transcriptional regulator [Desulfotomaculum sp.]|nr:sigma 54-interacting transcriptional regulator [Desulfotomaculum sp.]
MFNIHDYKSAVISLKHLFHCEITIWENKNIIYSTSNNLLINDALPSLKESIRSKIPIIINAPTRHMLCGSCPQLKNCPLILEVCYPFFEGKKSRVVCIQFKKNAEHIFNSMDTNALVQVLQNYAMYINSLLEKEKYKKLELLVRQQLSYVINMIPEGVALLDENKKIVGVNEVAEELNLTKILENQEFSQSLFSDLGRKKELDFTIPHTSGDLQLHRKSFFYNKKFIGALVHTKKTLQQKKYTSKEKNGAILPKVIGKDPSLIKVIDIVQQVASSESTILLRGESGTGKEMIAQAIHEISHRSTGPFVAINCAAIPEHLLESELFGYEEGSFTGAKKGGKPGKIELANGGTLFLDEVGDMPLALQVKLLRVIQEKCIDRIGGTKPIPVNVRLVAATNQNLEAKIKEGTFRKDLFFRLNVIPIYIPPLRERPGDINLLLNYFLKKYCISLNKSFKILSYAATQKLLSYPWPGNVRELENMVEYLVNIHDKDVISAEDLPLSHSQTPVIAKDAISDDRGRAAPLHHKYTSKSKRIRDEIIHTLDTYGWDTKGKKQAANHLGISLATLYRWIKKYKIKE